MATTNGQLQQAYNKGYSQGYRDGYRDATTNISRGITPVYAPDDIMGLPMQELNLSTRALNCLSGAGCQYIGDVVNMSEEKILYMRGLGKVTANEVAEALERYNIKHSAWSVYLVL